MSFDLAFSGEADFLEDEGRLLVVDCLPEERPDPVREEAREKRRTRNTG